jgi:16S rRNA processing protein RimM
LLPEIVILGRIGAPFGVKGWAHAYAFNSLDNNLLNYKVWQLQINGNWKAFPVLEAKLHGKGCVAHLTGCDTRDSAERLTNIEIGIPREDLPALPANEYYWADLIGMEVITEEGILLGQVDSLFETGANDVMVVKNGAREHLLPYVPEEYILNVDLQNRQIRVHWDPEF